MLNLRLFGIAPVFIRQMLVLLLFIFYVATPLQAEAETVNINKADAATLQHYLSGVGAVKAKAIVAYRNKHGKFKSPGDLKNVPGIGEVTIKKNRENISVSKGVARLNSKKTKSVKMKTSSKPRLKGSNKG